MRSLSDLVVSSAILIVLLAPGICAATQPHSWCNTGKPLVKNDAETDRETNNTINMVCAGDMAYCCTDGPTSSGSKPLRWDLACLQKAANYAYANTTTLGDYCGRYAWAQGPIRQKNTDGSTKYDFKQYFPRDFNLVALSGSLNALRDVNGPIAAKGNIDLNYFHLNVGRREEIALLAGARVGVGNGTVNGLLQYGTTYTEAAVTFVDATRPTAPTSPSLVNFDTAKTALVAMSQSLRDHYDRNGTAGKPNSALILTGTDPDLNVFKIDSSQLTNTTSYEFRVQSGSAAIITVTGTNPVFKYAGFTGSPPPAQKLLWNFPDAKTLTINGVGFEGSILAPNASANFQNGFIRGTVVVAEAMPANVELYTAPFQLACTGGLCLDKTWSCSSDTAMADDGTAAAVASEAGFLELEGGTYRSEGYDRVSPKHRVWYSFHPAKSGRKNKPLAVLFNGGPGSGTTPYLFTFNTGPSTFNLITNATDPTKDQVGALIPNPNSWTEFANLLYIDAPATGFSYPLKNDDGSMPDIGNDIDRDASNFLRVIVRFLNRHPALRTNRVILVGESYGGIRATLMLQYLFDHASLTKEHTNEGYRDLQLSAELDKYFSAALGANPTAAQIATKFSHQVLIEPALVGSEQFAKLYTVSYPTPDSNIPVYAVNSGFPMSNCTAPFVDDPKPCWTTKPPNLATGAPQRDPSCGAFDCDKPNHWVEGIGKQAATKLTEIATLNKALNVNVRSIAWMNDQTRKDKAYGRANILEYNVETADPIDMARAVNSGGFGPLNSDDNYLVLDNNRVHIGYGFVKPPIPPLTPRAARTASSVGAVTGAAFAMHVKNGVKSFITVAKYDAVIWSPSIPAALQDLVGAGKISLLAGLGYDGTYANGISVVRPGQMDFLYSSGERKSIAMPTSYASGHTVSLRVPADLLNDVVTWYRK